MTVQEPNLDYVIAPGAKGCPDVTVGDVLDVLADHPELVEVLSARLNLIVREAKP